MKKIRTSVFYIIIIILLFILCLYQFPELGKTINNITNTQISDDIKQKITDLQKLSNSKIQIINTYIDNIAPNTEKNIRGRLQKPIE